MLETQWEPGSRSRRQACPALRPRCSMQAPQLATGSHGVHTSRSPDATARARRAARRFRVALGQSRSLRLPLATPRRRRGAQPQPGARAGSGRSKGPLNGEGASGTSGGT